VAANLHDVPADTLQSATQELNDVKERAFWEVTDRQANFEWIAPERRKFLSQFQSLVTDRGAAASMAAA
jgi:hypothetical protein